MKTKTIKSSEARRTFSDVISRSEYASQRTIIVRQNHPAAAVVPVADLEAIRALEDKIDVREAEKILDDPQTTYRDWEEVKGEL